MPLSEAANETHPAHLHASAPAPRICVVTAGTISTCPRMLKAADALAEAGFAVRLVSTEGSGPWKALDESTLAGRKWRPSIVKWQKNDARPTWFCSGVRHLLSRKVAALISPGNCPIYIAARATRRLHTEIVRAILSEPADIYFAAGLVFAAVAEAGSRSGTPYAIDLEDFHSGEHPDDPEGLLANKLAARLEKKWLSRAAFLTAGSAAIAKKYEEIYGVKAGVINNVFDLPREAPSCRDKTDSTLRLYWFSQTIGPDRGLEDVVAAMGIEGLHGELHLRGRAIPEYQQRLEKLAADQAPLLRVILHPPAPPDQMITMCRDYDIGLALEQNSCENRRLCLTNKAFTYMLGGLAVAFTDTPGQRDLAADLGEGAILYSPGDTRGLAKGLAHWARNAEALKRSRTAAWAAAKRRWHWGHPDERGRLISVFTQFFERQPYAWRIDPRES